MTITISQLISYPIKSCAGVEQQKSQIDAMGLAGDRQLMLVDADGLFLSQRKHPKMAQIQPKLTGHSLIVNAPGMQQLTVDLQATSMQTLAVTIWKDTLQADSLQQQTNQWFSDYLNRPVSLVKYGQQSLRLIDPEFVNSGETVAFADGYPLLITHEASLNQLNSYLEQPVGMDRFRPNIVVHSELSAWDELNWLSLSTDQLKIHLVKPCTRCVITGVDQSTGVQTGTDVLKTLKQKFPHQEKAVFGINGIASTKKSTELSIGQSLKLD